MHDACDARCLSAGILRRTRGGVTGVKNGKASSGSEHINLFSSFSFRQKDGRPITTSVHHLESFLWIDYFFTYPAQSNRFEMCGRAAQTINVAKLAGESLGAIPEIVQKTSSSTSNLTSSCDKRGNDEGKGPVLDEGGDNYNMSPGMDAIVMYKEGGKVKMHRMAWGLVAKGGSKQHPLPSDRKARMSLHFQNLMFNARTDTLYSKPTFSRLASKGRSCVVALDGYFEWNLSPLPGEGKKQKQPYFVFRKKPTVSKKQCPYLLVAGLWTQVPTGLSDVPTLETFTVLTTEGKHHMLRYFYFSSKRSSSKIKLAFHEACKEIQWLHHRMPVCIWETDLALEWINNPCVEVLRRMDQAAVGNTEGFDWHMVKTEMSSLKFRSKTAIEPMKATTKSVIVYFQRSSVREQKSDIKKVTLANQEKEGKQELKRPASRSEGPSPKRVKAKAVPCAKKGLITSFFKKL